MLLQSKLVFLEKLGAFFEGILTVLAVDAFVVKFGGGCLYFRKHFKHVVGSKFASSD